MYSATISKPRTISKREFLAVAEHWQGYRDGAISRDTLTALSQNTSYIFGILKWLEDQ